MSAKNFILQRTKNGREWFEAGAFETLEEARRMRGYEDQQQHARARGWGGWNQIGDHPQRFRILEICHDD